MGVIAKEKKRLSNYETKLPLRQHDLEKATKELEMLTREFDMLSKDELQIRQAAVEVAHGQMETAEALVPPAFQSYISQDVEEAMSRQVQWKEVARLQRGHFLAQSVVMLGAFISLPAPSVVGAVDGIKEMLGVTSAQWKTMLATPLSLAHD